MSATAKAEMKCKFIAIKCWLLQKLTQYYKVIILQLKKSFKKVYQIKPYSLPREISKRECKPKISRRKEINNKDESRNPWKQKNDKEKQWNKSKLFIKNQQNR